MKLNFVPYIVFSEKIPHRRIVLYMGIAKVFKFESFIYLVEIIKGRKNESV